MHPSLHPQKPQRTQTTPDSTAAGLLEAPPDSWRGSWPPDGATLGSAPEACRTPDQPVPPAAEHLPCLDESTPAAPEPDQQVRLLPAPAPSGAGAWHPASPADGVASRPRCPRSGPGG